MGSGNLRPPLHTLVKVRISAEGEMSVELSHGSPAIRRSPHRVVQTIEQSEQETPVSLLKGKAIDNMRRIL